MPPHRLTQTQHIMTEDGSLPHFLSDGFVPKNHPLSQYGVWLMQIIQQRRSMKKWLQNNFLG